MSQSCTNAGAGKLEGTEGRQPPLPPPPPPPTSTMPPPPPPPPPLDSSPSVFPPLDPLPTPPLESSPPLSVESPREQPSITDTSEYIERLEREIRRMKSVYDIGKSVRVRQLEHMRLVHPDQKNGQLIEEGNIAAHGGKPIADAVVVMELEKDQKSVKEEDVKEDEKDRESLGETYWRRYGAKAELVFDMQNNMRFIEILKWRGSLVHTMSDTKYRNSMFYKFFTDAIGPSPLKNHSETYGCTGVVDITELNNYFNDDAAAIEVHKKMRREFEVLDEAARRKREEDNDFTKKAKQDKKRKETEGRRASDINSSRNTQRTRDHEPRPARDDMESRTAKRRKTIGGNPHDEHVRDEYQEDDFSQGHHKRPYQPRNSDPDYHTWDNDALIYDD